MVSAPARWGARLFSVRVAPPTIDSMLDGSTTCWTVIRGAAEGRDADRDAFARHYRRVVAAYLAARWRGGDRRNDVEDAIQEVFLECFKTGGVLSRARSGGAGGFRAFLRGVVRNVAARFEERGARAHAEDLRSSLEEREPALRNDEAPDRIFEATWARALVEEAADELRVRARTLGADASRRVELLELRFGGGHPIREIARSWNEEPVRVHRLYDRARAEFAEALRSVVAFHEPGTPSEIDRECKRLLESLS